MIRIRVVETRTIFLEKIILIRDKSMKLGLLNVNSKDYFKGSRTKNR